MNSGPITKHEDVLKVRGASVWTITEGQGPPLVLCHGGPGLCDNLGPLASMVADLATVHRYDQRASGRSTGEPPFTVEQWVGDLEALRLQWGYNRWIVGGHSWGASLALAYAAFYPEHVRGVLYISGNGLIADWRSEYSQELRARLEPDEASILEEYRYRARANEDIPSDLEKDAVRLLWRTDFADPARFDRLGEPLYECRINWTVNQQVHGDWLRLAEDEGFRDLVRALTVSILIIHGKHDPRPSWPARQLSEDLQHVEYHLIEDAGHLPWLEKPESVRSIISAWLNTTSDQQDAR